MGSPSRPRSRTTAAGAGSPFRSSPRARARRVPCAASAKLAPSTSLPGARRSLRLGVWSAETRVRSP
eukprot:10566008-Lingulodinium_polyedra.AAC.1